MVHLRHELQDLRPLQLEAYRTQVERTAQVERLFLNESCQSPRLSCAAEGVFRGHQEHTLVIANLHHARA